MRPRPAPTAAPAPALASAFVLAIALAPALGCGPGNGGDAGVTPDAGADTSMSAVEPRGTDATFNFSWLINGQDPTAAGDACTAAGVRFIRMNWVPAGGGTNGQEAFRFDCRLGRYRSAQPELRAGAFQIYWEAISADGRRVSLASGTLGPNGEMVPTLESVTVQRGAHIDFDEANRPDATFTGQPTNFSTGAGPLQVRLAWAPASGGGAATDCAAAGVATLNWTLRLSNNVVVDNHATREACSASFASLRWDRVNWDRYTLEVRGFDAMGRVAWSGRCANLLAAAAQPVPTHDCVVQRAP